MTRSMKTTAVAAVAALAWLGATDLDAAILFDDTTNGAAGISPPSLSSSLATGPAGITFTVGSSGMTLTSAVFGLYGNAQGTASVGLRLFVGNSASGTAAQELAAVTMSLDTIANGGTLKTFNIAGAGWTLSANTQYTVAVFGSSGTVTPRLGVTGVASGSWTRNGLTVDQFTKGGAAFAENFHIQLNGTISAGAVPGTGLAAITTVGLAGVSRRRRR